mmetsp:Transcript_92451/g.249472  ORF Transcript_92451/g.249472 Transcript_92451/m.249472 type:complete len:280 (+) Transcript_92451:69-908(+)
MTPARKVPEAFGVHSVGGSGSSHGTLREFRQRQRQELSRFVDEAGPDKITAMQRDLHLASRALGSGDADEMVRIVGCLAGYLEEPQRWPSHRQAEVAGVSGRELTEKSVCRIGQDRLPDMILQLIGISDSRGLDVDDRGTRKLLRVPFKHIRHLLHGRSLDSVVSGAQWQWSALYRVASGSSGGPDPQICLIDRIQRPAGLPPSERACATGTYEPNSRVKALATIVHDVANIKTLSCPKCAYTLRSAWFFMHPVTGHRSVLAPHNGHQACLTGMRRARY